MTGSSCGNDVWISAFKSFGMCGLIVAVAILLAKAGLGGISGSFFIVATMAAGYVQIRQSPWTFLVFSLWIWTLTPFTRRVIDFYHGFDPTSVILGAPNLLCLLMLGDILVSRSLPRLRESATGLLLLAPIGYGLAVSFVQGMVVPGLVGAADWIAPMLYYYFLLAHASKVTALEQPLRAFLTLNMFVVGCYGLLQYLSPPGWDVAWLTNSGIATAGNAMAGGRAIAYQIRVFTTLNSSGLAAPWLVMLLLLSMYFRTAATPILAAICLVVLFTTLVRQSLGALLAGLVLVFLLGGARLLRPLALSVIAAFLIAGVLIASNPTMEQHLIARFNTVNDLGDDDSALTRLAIYRSALGWIDDHPLGLGIWALGRGAVTVKDADMISIDSGPLAIYLSLGWVAGSVYLAGFVAVLAQAAHAFRRSRSEAALVAAISAFAGGLGLIFGNVIGLLGVVIWLCAGYASALGIAARLASDKQRQSVTLSRG